MNRPRFARAAALGVLVATGVLVVPENEAEAGGYLTARYGADEGTPAMPNAFAIYYNPAALGGTQGTTITGDLSVLARFIRYTRPASALSPDSSSKTDPAYIGANTGTANLSNVLALPFLGVNTDFGTKNLHAGYAVYVPLGGLASWTRRAGEPGIPGSTDGVQRWANISGDILAVYNTFAIAYKIEPARLSIGASVSPIYHTLSTTAARNADGSDDTVANGQLIEGRAQVSATGFNLGATGGLYWEPTDDLHFGASYISQPGFGETKLSGTLKTQLGSGAASTAKIDFLQTYPDIIRFGLTYHATPKLLLRGDFDFERWSTFKNQCIVAKGASCNVASDGRIPSGSAVQLNLPRNWQNAVSFRAGPAYRILENLEGFGSVAFGTSAVPKSEIDATTFDSDALFLTAGVHWRASEHWSIAGSYNHVYYFTVNTQGTSQTNLPSHPSADYNLSRSPSADGRYRSQVGFLNANVAYTF